jgi:glycosyltransferase involved in cell wall biosynthesis
VKIDLLTTGLTTAGAETQAVRLATGLAARGHEVRVVSMMRPAAFEEELIQAGVPVESLEMRRGVPDPRALLRLVALLRRRRPQVLVSFLYHANILGRLATRFAGVPNIASVRNEHFGGRVREAIFRATNPLSAAVVTNCETVANSLAARGILPVAKSIYNMLAPAPTPLDLDSRQKLRREVGCGDDGFLWLAAGRLEDQKDFRTLVEAAATPGIGHVAIAGDGPLRASLESTAPANVRFLGLRHDLAQWMQAADAFVLASRYEGFPNVVLEAAAAGLPIVSTNVGGVSEWVACEWMVPPGMPAELAGKMLEMQREPTVNAVQDTLDRCQPDRVLDDWERLLRQVTSGT